MARKVGQWEEEEVARAKQSGAEKKPAHHEEDKITAEDQQLPEILLGLQHQLGTAEKSNLVDRTTTGFHREPAIVALLGPQPPYSSLLLPLLNRALGLNRVEPGQQDPPAPVRRQLIARLDKGPQTILG
ncbi:hypothetical protein STEG23_005848 [Scotinomys teguina]